MSVNSPIHKYLDAKDFINLCSKMNVYLHNKPEDLLEAYDRHDLIKPVFRLCIPNGYLNVKFGFLFRQSPDAPLPKEYEDIGSFLDNHLKNYYATSSPWIDRTFVEGHPIDWAYKEGKSFVKKPSCESFKPWDEYKVVVGKIDEYPQYSISARHYYAQWQVFLVEEADAFFSRKITPFLPSKSHDLDLTGTTLSLTEWTDAFEVLAEYRFRSQIILEKYLNQTTNKVLEGSHLRDCYPEIEKQAQIAFSKILEERWIGFLRQLCTIYFSYIENEKIRLSEFMRSHIRAAIDLFLNAMRLPYSTLLEKVGYDIGDESYYGIFPLERICPDDAREKKRARDYLLSLKDEFNTLFPSAAIHDNEIDEIIESSISNRNGALLSSIVSINREFRKDSLFWHETIWNCYIGTLATAVETFLGRKKYSDSEYLSDCIDKATGNLSQRLRTEFNSFLGTFLTPMQPKIGDAADPMEFCFKVALLRNPSAYRLTISDSKLIDLSFLLLANLTRNYINHWASINPEFFGSNFIELYKSLIFTLFYFKKH